MKFNYNCVISVDVDYASTARQELNQKMEKAGFTVSLPLDDGPIVITIS